MRSRSVRIVTGRSRASRVDGRLSPLRLIFTLVSYLSIYAARTTRISTILGAPPSGWAVSDENLLHIQFCLKGGTIFRAREGRRSHKFLDRTRVAFVKKIS